MDCRAGTVARSKPTRLVRTSDAAERSARSPTALRTATQRTPAAVAARTPDSESSKASASPGGTPAPRSARW